jgi:hypothetical protein
MYQVDLSDEARAATGELPHHALEALAELVDVLTLEPESGRLYRGPGSDLRTIALLEDGSHCRRHPEVRPRASHRSDAGHRDPAV